MRQTKIFTKTRKEAPKDEVSKNAKLLIRAGFINKEQAGVYDYLPLGLRVINKIENIIREEMNLMGGQELNLTALQEKKLWEKTDRWNDDVVDNWFKTKLSNGTELGLGFTHEEPLTNLLKDHVNSYKDLPLYIYQFQVKFRNELRSKSGIMRGREFLMKDLYSFSRTEEEHNNFYNSMKDSYTRVFEKVGLGDYTYLTAASGGSFGDNSDEFQTVSEAGEDIIYIDKDKKKAINKEIYADEVINSEGLNKSTLEEKKSIEVGNIFPLGTKFSDALELTFTDESGSQNPVIMGSYGIGIGRLMGTVVEVLSDEKGIVWPETISPFDAHIILMSPEDDEVRQYSDKIYNELNKSMHDILYDDRTKKAGEKLNDADLIGIPYQIIIGKKTLEEGKIEVKNRKNGEITHLDESAVLGGKFKV